MNFKVVRVPRVRAYYNATECAGKEWSIDFGPDSIEMQCGSLKIQAQSDSGLLSLCKDITTGPHGWLEFVDVNIEVIGNAIWLRDACG
jgi:hypothetical protein